MTIDPADYGPTLPLPGMPADPEPICPCLKGEGHTCRPSFMTEDEWARCNCIAGDQHYRADHPGVSR